MSVSSRGADRELGRADLGLGPALAMLFGAGDLDLSSLQDRLRRQRSPDRALGAFDVAVLVRADDRVVASRNDSLEHLVHVALAVGDVNQLGLRAVPVPQLAGVANHVPPLATFLLLEGQPLALAGFVELLHRPSPHLVVHQPQHVSLGTDGEPRVHPKSLLVLAVHRPQSLSRLQAQEHQAGRVLDHVHLAASLETPAGVVVERNPQMICTHAVVLQQAIVALGGRRSAGGLTDAVAGSAGALRHKRNRPQLQPVVGERSRPQHRRRPQHVSLVPARVGSCC